MTDGSFTTARRGHALVDVESHVAVLVGAGADPVVAGEEPGDEARLDHLGGEWVGQLDVPDLADLAQHRADAPPVVTAEVAAHPLAQVGGLADVEHLVAMAAEHVHAGRAGQLGGGGELGGLRMPGELGEHDEIVDTHDPEPRRPLDQQVEQVGGRECVVEGAMRGLVVEPEAIGERAEPAVGDLVAEQSPGERGGVDHGRAVVEPLIAGECGAHEREIERGVVGDEHRIAEEVDEAAEHALDAGGGGDHGVGQPGEHGDLRRDRPPGFTRVWNVPMHSPPRTLTTPISVIMSSLRLPPVVSRSSTQNVASCSGVPLAAIRSSKLR